MSHHRLGKPLRGWVYLVSTAGESCQYSHSEVLAVMADLNRSGVGYRVYARPKGRGDLAWQHVA